MAPIEDSDIGRDTLCPSCRKLPEQCWLSPRLCDHRARRVVDSSPATSIERNPDNPWTPTAQRLRVALADNARLREALTRGERWWESYAHDTDEQKIIALIDACSYWHSCWEMAMGQVEELRGAG